MKIKINKRVEILWKNEYYRSNVQDVKSGNFVISIPMQGGKYLPIHVGESVEMHYYDGDSIYSFSGEIVSRGNEGLPVLIVRTPGDAKKIQRRRYVRVPHTGELKYLEVPKDYKLRRIDQGTISRMTNALTVDISGGGLKFITHDDVREKVLLVMLQIDDLRMIAKGEVVRCIYDEVEKAYDCGINYTDIGEQDREKLISYIFKLMRQQIRKA